MFVLYSIYLNLWISWEIISSLLLDLENVGIIQYTDGYLNVNVLQINEVFVVSSIIFYFLWPGDRILFKCSSFNQWLHKLREAKIMEKLLKNVYILWRQIILISKILKFICPLQQLIERIINYQLCICNLFFKHNTKG